MLYGEGGEVKGRKSGRGKCLSMVIGIIKVETSIDYLCGQDLQNTSSQGVTITAKTKYDNFRIVHDLL